MGYYSATFTLTERNYDIYKRELLAVMKSLGHWRLYLGWTKEPFSILTDHANLQYWKAPRNLNQQMAQWHTDLQEYDYKIQHIPEKANTPADALSRPPDANQGEQDNKNVTVIPPHKFVNLAIFDDNDALLLIPRPKPSEERKCKIMVFTHMHPSAGHPGRDETIQKAKQVQSWDRMNTWITDYVKSCATCQQNKILTHWSKISLYRITTKEGTLPFQRVAMDLITGLPVHKGKDTILTIVNHGCSRAAIFLPCSTTIMGPEIMQLYMNHVYRWFGLSTKIISDWDPRFTFHFGKALSQKLGIQQNLSTVFHPQTDGILERKNQWIKQYLWLVTSTSSEDWTHWLALATAVHNNKKNTTTGLSPNQILLGYDLSLIPSGNSTLNSDLVEKRMEALLEKQAQAIDAINQVAKRDQGGMAWYKLGDQVWLEATHLKLCHQKMKLTPKCYSPFIIIKEISSVVYQIELPASWGIHNVFHASLSSPYHETAAFGPNFSCSPPNLIGGEEEYEVEQILNHRCHGRSRRLQYFIKWKGYPESDNT